MDINIARFDLVSMRLVVLCAEWGSLSAAVKRAHCSISAGSQRLTALEEALGKTLFIRDYRGMQLTDAGERFVQHAKVILGHIETLQRQVAAAHDIRNGEWTGPRSGSGADIRGPLPLNAWRDEPTPPAARDQPFERRHMNT